MSKNTITVLLYHRHKLFYFIPSYYYVCHMLSGTFLLASLTGTEHISRVSCTGQWWEVMK
jgi:hypothetical protein